MEARRDVRAIEEKVAFYAQYPVGLHPAVNKSIF